MLVAGVIGAFMLAGCKIDVETKVPLSGLLSEGIKTAKASLLIEVAACNDHKDSRNPSDMLIKVRDAVAKAFPVAVYKECFRKEFNSFANFEIPANYGLGSDDEWAQTKGVRIISYPETNGAHSIVAGLPEDVRKGLEASSKEKYKIEAFKVENVRIRVALENDTGQDQQVVAFGVFLENAPYIGNIVRLVKGKTYNIRLSDVSTTKMFQVNTGKGLGADFLTVMPPK
ncbi:DUF7424 family protein [Achromobacter pestifer]|uniref:DUF7424 domain-containing protein n=1 Tax=Achromobacter pestifer TaxID=1353889 RepID=A0A6S6YUC6_9BURK|nr:hypothetical protein LMG3431_02322 [Achromobacter pestifer]